MEHVITVDVQVLTLLTGTVIPLLVGFLTKQKASSRFKAVANLVLSVLAGVAGALLEAHGTLNVSQIFTAAMTTWLASGVSYTALLKPTGVASAVQSIAPEFGVGTAVEGEEPDSPPPLDETARVTTLKGHPVYHTEDGTLFIPKSEFQAEENNDGASAE